jgi:hypothetical protein
MMYTTQTLLGLLTDAPMNRKVTEAFMDGAYDTRNSYILLRTGDRCKAYYQA